VKVTTPTAVQPMSDHCTVDFTSVTVVIPKYIHYYNILSVLREQGSEENILT
jgi:hypothetical protein